MGHSREIRQLWFVAKYYFEESEQLKDRWGNWLNTKLKDIMDFFEDRIPMENCKRELSLLVAHLNSAAVRLCTINERFRVDWKAEIFPYYQDVLLKLDKQKCLKREDLL